MIDIISSSIRVGRILRDHEQLNLMYEFFQYISTEKNNHISFEYKKLLTSKFTKYGFYAFDVVDKIIEQNLKSDNEIARNLSEKINDFVSTYKDYKKVLVESTKYGAILNDYIAQLLCSPNDFPQIKLESISLKLQQSSNELSTSVLRSGVLSWLNDPLKRTLLQKNLSFINSYEEKTAPFEHLYPYNSKTIKIISSLNKTEQKIALHLENIRLIQFLAKNGIIQGFFFELYDIPLSRISKLKESHTKESIHPVIIKTDFIYPSDHLIFFKYTWKNKSSYLLTKRITMHFSDNKTTTKLYGYCYPTNEYSLLMID